MPQSKQATKRLRQNEYRRTLNKSFRSSMKTAIKKVMQAIETGEVDDARRLLPQVMKQIDKAAKHSIIHRNNAARKKSQLSRRVRDLERTGASAPLAS